jgi:hypothetical protein
MIVGYLVSATASLTGGFLFMIVALLVSAACFVWLQLARMSDMKLVAPQPERSV